MLLVFIHKGSLVLIGYQMPIRNHRLDSVHIINHTYLQSFLGHLGLLFLEI